MAAPSPSSDGSPPSWERRQQREQRGAKNANGGAELENLPSHFLRARSLSSNSFRSFFDFERAQILWFLKNNAICYPSFVLFTHCYKIPFWTEKMVRNFFQLKIGFMHYDNYWINQPYFPPTFDKKIFSLILLLLITKNQENHVNYDYDSNRFSVQTWRKKRDRKRRKIKSKIWEIDDETMFFWAKWYLCVESALSMTDMARQRAIWMGQDSNYGFSRQRKSQWCVTSCTWNWIVD